MPTLVRSITRCRSPQAASLCRRDGRGAALRGQAPRPDGTTPLDAEGWRNLAAVRRLLLLGSQARCQQKPRETRTSSIESRAKVTDAGSHHQVDRRSAGETPSARAMTWMFTRETLRCPRSTLDT